MALAVVKASSLEHVRWLKPHEEDALREVKGATVKGKKAEPEARRIYDPLTEDIRDRNCWILCDCLPDEWEQPAIAPRRAPRGMRLGNRPNAEVPHDVNCVFRLREASQDTSRYLFNPLTHGRQGAASGERDRRREPGGRGGRSVPTVARNLKCLIREARLHTLAGAERFPSPADWLAELARAAAAFSVAPNVPASEVLFTDPASWRSGEFRERLDARAQKWPKGSPPCGFLCWVAHDVEGRDVNGKSRGAGHVRVTSRVDLSGSSTTTRVVGPYLFLGALEQSADRSRMGVLHGLCTCPSPRRNCRSRSSRTTSARRCCPFHSWSGTCGATRSSRRRSAGSSGSSSRSRSSRQGCAKVSVGRTSFSPSPARAVRPPVSPAAPSTTATRCATSSRSWGSATRNTGGKRKRPTAGWSGSAG